jgi:hypothetical protein
MTIKRVFTADWATAKSWGSMKLKALAAAMIALQQGWGTIPDGWKSQLPASVPHWLGYAAIASIAGAAYSQVTKKAQP